jgi:drug/metabolite transporter (DMT)-like permease
MARHGWRSYSRESMVDKVIVFGGYAVIIALCAILGVYVVAQPGPGVSDRSTNLLGGIGVGFAGCVFYKSAVEAVRARLTRR